MLTIVRPIADRTTIARAILEGLPNWFGIPESRENYVARAGDLPMVAASCDGAIVGFLSLEWKTRVSAEIHVIGVRPLWHRRGVGRSLIAAAEHDLREEGHRYLIVKTISDRRPDPFYDLTRKFYESVGFEPIDELPELWGADNPCLLMLKPLAPSARQIG